MTSPIQEREPYSSRPLLAIVCESLPPYRVQLHHRIASEIPEIRLVTLCTHDPTDNRWPPVDAVELETVAFAPNEPTLHLIDRRYWWSEWQKGGRLIQWLREHRAAAVILHGYNDPARLRILVWCRRKHIPVFVSGDSNIRDDNRTGLRKWIKRLFVGSIIRMCDGVLPFGNRGLQYFARYGAAPERMFFFPMEPDYGLIEAVTAADIEAVRRQYGLSASRRRIIFSGRLIGLKRIDLLIDAFTAVAPDRPEWDLLIVGGGPLRESLQARVPAALRGRVVFTGGVIDPDTIAALYRASDVLALPSEIERWGIVINEATAAGLAIVTSDRPGAVDELVRDGVNGRVFAVGDLRGLIESLSDVTSPGKVDAMKNASLVLIADWRRTGDPVQGLRRALRASGVDVGRGVISAHGKRDFT